MQCSRLPLIALVLVSLALNASVQAESSQRQGPFTVHYSALTTTQLSPEIARQYAITRSDGRGLVNIAVRRDREDGGTEAAAAQVSGTAKNDAQQLQTLNFREVREGDAIYYLAEPKLRPGDRLAFEISVQPRDSAEAIAIRFAQQFFPAQ